MFENFEGQRVPRRIFRTRHNHQWVDVDADDVFKGKTVIVFVLPGTFTPTSSSTPGLRHDQPSPTFRRYGVKRYGVDEVVCISTSDAFVINEWRNVQKAFNTPFPHKDSSRTMGRLAPNNDFGFGDGSQPYSLLVKDGVIQKMFVEPGLSGDPFGVFDADSILAYIMPSVAKSAKRDQAQSRRMSPLRASQSHAA